MSSVIEGSLYTPGPWTLTSYGAQWQVEDARGDRLIADAYGTGANARLIAAAPDLLEALEKVQLAYGSYGPNASHPHIWEAVSDAIAKATGTTE